MPRRNWEVLLLMERCTLSHIEAPLPVVSHEWPPESASLAEDMSLASVVLGNNLTFPQGWQDPASQAKDVG